MLKHGDYLRTLGGAMTAQCKVLHLLLSQSDYPKDHRVSYRECYLKETLVAAICNKRSTTTACPLSCLQAHRRRVQVPGMTLLCSPILCFIIIIFLILVEWPLKGLSTWYRTLIGLYAFLLQ